ncbi:hypothetical protein PVAG01_00982 [Phlyctema vagabunda]|uniref:DUF3835 domain-containing protein n=1 Tax=Phlyctema vagabunda TaxID=108571 RepID=A0ABR4PVT9_9HELO
MATTVKDSFLDLEKHRRLLEENIEKLRRTLRHWQTWEAEYEGLKEEILSTGPSPTRHQLEQLARAYEGDLVTKKEIEDIIGGQPPRNAEQVVNVLDRRMDYVQQNIKTVEKQLEAAEHKLAVATVISTPEVRNEEGLPLTEIIEDLDEDGNVIASRVSTPGNSKQQLLEVLHKAGVKDIPGSTPTKSAIPYEGIEEQVKSPAPLPQSTKKEVKFAEDTKPEINVPKSDATRKLEDIMAQAKELEATPSEPPIIPTDDSPEDAALRREMLQFGMSEVGSVVAELELEDASDWSDENYEDATSTDDDEEDSFGRSTKPVVDDELRKEMIKLEERLGLRMMENVGQKADLDVVDEGIGRITISGPDAAVESDSISDSANKPQSALSKPEATGKSTKKSVRFSEELDVSPGPEAQQATKPKERTVAPIGDIVERKGPAQIAAPSAKKASRFKASRGTTSGVVNGPFAISKMSGPPLDLQPASAPKAFSAPIQFSPTENSAREVPTGPEGRTLAPKVVERDVISSASAAEPDELDSNLLHQEVATEYHKMRNRMIQRQGGFLKEEESEIVPFTEEEGGPKKMSRFKAARLAKS